MPELPGRLPKPKRASQRAKASGCVASLTGPGLRSAKPSEFRMRPAEKTKGKPGRPRPAIFRVYSPKASARKLHQRIRETKNPSTELTAPRGVRRFSGASSVASALGIRLGATPRGPLHPNTCSSTVPSKPDISTLLALGHFYFALTAQIEAQIKEGTSK